MLRSFPLLLALVLVVGCLGTAPGGRPQPEPVDAEAGETRTLVQYLKAGYRLDETAPHKDTPDRVASTPTVNGYANEDIRVFEGSPLPQSINVSRARIHAFYSPDAATTIPMGNQSDPTTGRALVFWLGSARFFPLDVSTFADRVLVPGRTYQAIAEFELPPGGWHVLAGERIRLAVATLIVSGSGSEIRFLVDATSTPSRIELVAAPRDSSIPSALVETRSSHTIPGNSGLFTGATAGRLDSIRRIEFPVPAEASYVEVRVVFRTNAGGKSDLDLLLHGPGGVVAASTTPYQNEALRLLRPNLVASGAGTYVAEVHAYSGANTMFELVRLMG